MIALRAALCNFKAGGSAACVAAWSAFMGTFVSVGTRYKTGHTCEVSGHYRFDGYTDGTSTPSPRPEEMNIPLSREETRELKDAMDQLSLDAQFAARRIREKPSEELNDLRETLQGEIVDRSSSS
jgi:hypothetical protein